MKTIIRSTAVVLLLISAALCVAAQTKNIELKSGKNVLKGQVRKGTERLYTFQATGGHKLSVRLISADRTSVFSVNLQDRIEYETIEDKQTFWSGELPESDSGIYSIAVKTRKPTAAFTLEIELR